MTEGKVWPQKKMRRDVAAAAFLVLSNLGWQDSSFDNGPSV